LLLQTTVKSSEIPSHPISQISHSGLVAFYLFLMENFLQEYFFFLPVLATWGWLLCVMLPKQAQKNWPLFSSS